jgi:cbb3-type cytochrome oxidase maturation protein
MGVAVLFIASLLIAGVALVIFFLAFRKEQFDSLKKDALIPFTEEEPVGIPTDQLFKSDFRSQPDETLADNKKNLL